MVKVSIWAYYCMNSYVTTRARSTRVLQYCHFDNFVLLTSSRLDGVTSPYPCENIIAGNYILADTQTFLSKRHRQQNKEILIRHSPGIGECFLLSNIQLTEKIKKISSGGCKNASQRFVLMKGYLGGKNKKLSSRACIYALHLLNICKDIFEPA